MADYKTHIAVSSGLGMVYGGLGHFFYGMPFEDAMIATGLCSVAGMLPDLDSPSSVPHREMLTIISVLAPVLMLPRFEELEMTRGQIVFAAGFIYMFVRYVIGSLFQRYTTHRGMWHSIPAAMVAGLATYLVCHDYAFDIRLFKSWAVVLGFVSHLVLDEIYAVNWEGKRIRMKSSFGTALKFYSPSRSATLFTYASLFLMVAIASGDHYAMRSWKNHFQPSEISKNTKEWLQQWFTSQSKDLGESDNTIIR